MAYSGEAVARLDPVLEGLVEGPLDQVLEHFSHLIVRFPVQP